MTQSNEIRRILDLMEAQSRTMTKDKSSSFDDFDLGDLMGDDQSNKGSLTTGTKTNAPATSIGKSVGKADTQKMSRAAMDKMDGSAGRTFQAMQDKMADFGMEADPMDTDGVEFEEPAKPNTLPANIRKDLDTVSGPDVKWHNLPETPGYRQVIGAFGPLFRSFGMDPKQTKVSTTLTSGEADMRKLVAHLNNSAVKDDKFSLEAFDINPEEYHIEGALMYHMAGETYMVIKEKMGQGINYYVYSAPDGGKRSKTAVGSDKAPQGRIR